MTTAGSPPSCPIAEAPGERITLAHGEGGRLTRQLITQQLLPIVGNQILSSLGDAAVLPPVNGSLAFTTDSFVVSPLFFPGGDIGTLAIYGTVNDLAVSGARPRWISLSLILEEGLPFAVLNRVLQSIAGAARDAQVVVVTGDTKVVPQGAVDQIFINTSGIGDMIRPAPSGPSSLRPGDELIVTGPLGQHGIAILACREQLGFEPPPTSDCAALTPAVDLLREGGCPIRAMRDATRGGVAAVLHEWAACSNLTMQIDEALLPVTAVVRGVCELLGLDALHIANEGVMVVAVPEGWGVKAVAQLHQLSLTAAAAVIGRVTEGTSSPVLVRRGIGTYQPLDEPLGSPLPRIC